MVNKMRRHSYSLENLFPEAKLFKNPGEQGYTGENVEIYNQIMKSFTTDYEVADQDNGSKLRFHVISRKRPLKKYRPSDVEPFFWEKLDERVNLGKLLSREKDRWNKPFSVYEKGSVYFTESLGGRSSGLGKNLEYSRTHLIGVIKLNDKPYHSSIIFDLWHHYSNQKFKKEE